MAIVQEEDEQMPTESSELTKWIKSRVENVNKPAFALAVQRAEVSPDDETQKKSEHRRPASGHTVQALPPKRNWFSNTAKLPKTA